MNEVSKPCRSYFILKLEGPLRTAVKIQEAAGLNTLLMILTGDASCGEASFVRVESFAKEAIQKWLSKEQSSFQPTFVPISKADKDLSGDSMYPTLGLDSTLPHHRANYAQASFSPAQDQYPVWYFFYGTIADPDVLTSLLSLSEPPIMRSASITGGIIKTWAGKYKAIVDGPASISTGGCAYLVTSRDHEDALSFYETEKYEVARCSITMQDNGEVVEGLTYRFVGSP
ncbi:MAG: hypothetical protein M1830_001478 [Pleopsidium flavum]|nr:MAG: hypothetical protein M1830_001478 [Pleopsidium flavum]